MTDGKMFLLYCCLSVYLVLFIFFPDLLLSGGLELTAHGDRANFSTRNYVSSILCKAQR